MAPTEDLDEEEPWIISPKDQRARWWEVIIVVSTIITCILDLFMASGFNSTYIGIWIVLYLFDFLYIVDIAVQFFTAYHENGVLVTNRKLIAKSYLKSTFALDIISVIPMEIVTLFVPSSSPWKLLTQLRLPRLIRLYRMVKLFGKKILIYTMYVYY